MQLMAGDVETAARGGKRAMELVTGIRHSVFLEYGFQTAFIKRPVVGHERKSLYQRFNLCPDFGESRLIVGVLTREAMNFGCPVSIVIRGGADEAVKSVDDLAAAYHDNAYAADA